MSRLFLGVDAGGSATRALLATGAGDVIGTGHAEGANTWSSGTSVPDVLASAMRGALQGSDPAMVVGGVIALAGGSMALAGDDTAPGSAAAVTGAWRRLDLPGSPEVVPDVLAAYAAGTTAPRGVVLVAGTGSIAAAISGWAVRRRSGGHGWMLGDEGSAVWLGLQGIRAALRALDGTGLPTLLATTIPEALGAVGSDPEETMTRIVHAAHGRPPAQLGRLAPVVLHAAGVGDPVAQESVSAGVDHLTRLVEAVIDHDEPRVIVLAGSLGARAPLIGDALRARFADRWPAASVAVTTSGEAGAVALAIHRHTGAPVDIATLARLRGEGPAQQTGRSGCSARQRRIGRSRRP